MTLVIEEGVHSTVDFFWDVTSSTAFGALAGAIAPHIFTIAAVNPLSGAIFGAMMGFGYGVVHTVGKHLIERFVPEGIPHYLWLILAYVVSIVVGAILAALLVTGIGVAVMTPGAVALFAVQLLVTVALVNMVWWVFSHAGKAFLDYCRN